MASFTYILIVLYMVCFSVPQGSKVSMERGGGVLSDIVPTAVLTIVLGLLCCLCLSCHSLCVHPIFCCAEAVESDLSSFPGSFALYIGVGLVHPWRR